MSTFTRVFLATFIAIASANAHASSFFLPKTNTSEPEALKRLIDTLENSTETRALAYVSEDKVLGTKFWVWGHNLGDETQEESNRLALELCTKALNVTKAKIVKGQPLYDLGTKRCELYKFKNTPLPSKHKRQ